LTYFLNNQILFEMENIYMNLKNSKILLTGADGFIGSHLTEKLVKDGFDVRAMAIYNSLGSWGWLDTLDRKTINSIEVVQSDIRDRNGVREAAKGCDVILNLAALISIPYSYHAPFSYVDTNLKGTMNVLEAARDFGISRVVHTSTSEVYGSAQFVPITEEHQLNAQSPYAATKIAADMMALSYHMSFDVPVSVVRPFNTYGPRQSSRAVIPAIISQIASGADTLKLGNLDATRDFTFVEDTAHGFVQVAETDACIGTATNIGSGFEISIRDLAAMIVDVMDAKVIIEQEQKRIRPERSEVDRLFAGVEKAESLFNWAPQYGGIKGLKKGIKKTANWFVNPQNLKHYQFDKFHL